MFVPLPRANSFGVIFKCLCDKHKASIWAQQASAGTGWDKLNQHGAQRADTKIPFLGHNHLDKMCRLWSLFHMCKWCTLCPSSDGDHCGAGCRPIIEGSHHSGDGGTNNPSTNGLSSQMIDIPLPVWFILPPSVRTIPGSTLYGRWCTRLFLTSPHLTLGGRASLEVKVGVKVCQTNQRGEGGGGGRFKILAVVTWLQCRKKWERETQIYLISCLWHKHDKVPQCVEDNKL